MESDPTIVEYSSKHERYKCGYCGLEDTNYSHGMWAHQMKVEDYQDLIDRGWRRSGMYCYKPTMHMTCCPQYTIKCHALEFKLSKSHKKVLKRVNKYLITGVKPGLDNKATNNQELGDLEEDTKNVRDDGSTLAESMKPSAIVLPSSIEKGKKNVKGSASETTTQPSVETQTRSMSATVTSMEDNQNQNTESKLKYIPKPGAGPDPCKPKCKKAKVIRAQRWALKHSQTGDVVIKQKQVKQSQEKSLEDFLNEPDLAQNPAHKLEFRLIRSCPASDAFKSTFSTEHSVYHKYQTTIHKDPPHKPNTSQYNRFLCDSPLLIILCRTAPLSGQLRVSYRESHAIYVKYQMDIHNDEPEDCSTYGFKMFLVDSPLEETYEENGPPKGYGSFHHQYLLDGKIIAVGVLDVLPVCVSSVYLYYDPAYSFLGLGVYSALREIALVRQLHLSAPNLKYYYMGFYIHTCPKMKYKGQYTPSFLACPETYKWVPLEKCRPKLDVNKYSRLSDSGTDEEEDVDVNNVLVLYEGNMLPYGIYKTTISQGADSGHKKKKGADSDHRRKISDEDQVREYAGFVGKKCAERMLLVRK